jgi:protoporphyrinogen oxidase
MNKIYDYIVVGGGIAGLYANYLLADKYNGILLEKENDLGGRVYEMKWHGSNIKIGAGIMTEDNKHLLKLLKKLNIKPNSFYSETKSFHKPFDMNQAIKKIKLAFKTHYKSNNKLTMKQFLDKHFDAQFVKNFITNCEYRDFIDSDPYYFIKYYKIDDMTFDLNKVFILEWKNLVDKLAKSNCHKNSEVKKIEKINDNLFKVSTAKETYFTKKLILGLTLKPLDKLASNLIDFEYKDYVGTVEFVRIYTYHKNGYSSDKIGHYNLVPNQLQKIIKITDKILMASYSDNKEAKYWKKVSLLDKKSQIKKVENKLQDLNIDINKVDDVEIGYWNEGVHYYKPFGPLKFNQLLKKLSKPIKNVFVIGEIISKKHGYVEGAIESVNRTIKF